MKIFFVVSIICCYSGSSQGDSNVWDDIGCFKLPSSSAVSYLNSFVQMLSGYSKHSQCENDCGNSNYNMAMTMKTAGGIPLCYCWNGKDKSAIDSDHSGNYPVFVTDANCTSCPGDSSQKCGDFAQSSYTVSAKLSYESSCKEQPASCVAVGSDAVKVAEGLDSNSIGTCKDMCRMWRFPYAGAHRGECYCWPSSSGKTISYDGRYSYCNSLCPGSNYESCGGTYSGTKYATAQCSARRQEDGHKKALQIWIALAMIGLFLLVGVGVCMLLYYLCKPKASKPKQPQPVLTTYTVVPAARPPPTNTYPTAYSPATLGAPTGPPTTFHAPPPAAPPPPALPQPSPQAVPQRQPDIIAIIT